MISNSKEKYRQLCTTEKSISIFSRDWWLDAVCGDNWDVCLVEKGGQVIATMPYHFRKNRFGMKVICQPQETQTLGPWLRSSDAKNSNRLSQEKDLLTELINQLPEYSQFHQNWNHESTNWLPFYWRGFEQTTRYTYRLPDLSDLDRVWSGFRDNIRSDIRKASGRFELVVQDNLSIEDFLALNYKTFERQGMVLPYTETFIRHLDAACLHHDARAILIAVDPEGRHHAGVYIVWDNECAYYLMGGGDPKLRSSGATSLCLWAAIQHAATLTKCFDFEGSMIEPVERFFRAFGAVQTPYFSLSKTPSRILRARNCLSKLLA